MEKAKAHHGGTETRRRSRMCFLHHKPKRQIHLFNLKTTGRRHVLSRSEQGPLLLRGTFDLQTLMGICARLSQTFRERPDLGGGAVERLLQHSGLIQAVATEQALPVTAGNLFRIAAQSVIAQRHQRQSGGVRKRDVLSTFVTTLNLRLAIGTVAEDRFMTDKIPNQALNFLFTLYVAATHHADSKVGLGQQLTQLSLKVRREQGQRPGLGAFDGGNGAQVQSFPSFAGVSLGILNPEIVEKVIAFAQTLDRVDDRLAPGPAFVDDDAIHTNRQYCTMRNAGLKTMDGRVP